MAISENKSFEKINYRENFLAKGEYECCTFKSCDFSNSDLSGITFMECEFEACNLSLVRLNNTGLKGVKFINCKMLGVNFSYCNPFLLSLRFEGCWLNLSFFQKLKLKGTVFTHCDLQEVNFSDADLTGALLDNCDLGKAVFEHTILEKADLISAYNYSIDPEINRIKKAKFSRSGLSGLLDKYNIEIV